MGNPKLTIAICTFNRGQFLSNCLAHLAAQKTAYPYEVLVVDNSSTDNTPDVCEEFRQKAPQVNFSYHLEPQQGLSFARNRSIEEASGQYISYLDDDAYSHPTYVEEIVGFMDANPQVAAIGGKILPLYQDQEPAWMSKYLLPLVAGLDMGPHAKPFGARKFPIGANMAFRKSILEKMEGFDTNLGRKGSFLGSGEEKDLFLRMKKQNMDIYYVPQVTVDHYIPSSRTQSSYIKDMAYGIGKSEAIRLQDAPPGAKIGKLLDELMKVGATLGLALAYSISGHWPKAKMLINFRKWVFTSYLNG